MGLDQSLIRVSRPSVVNRVYERGELEGVLLLEEDAQSVLYSDILPYTVPVMVRNRYYNMQKIRADHGLSERAYIGCWGSGGCTVCDADSELQVFLDRATLERDYIEARVERMLYAQTEEIYYWRKHYDVQEWVWNEIGNVENTGYYVLDARVQRELYDEFGIDLEVEEPSETSAICYWEWY